MAVKISEGNDLLHSVPLAW